MGTIARMDVRLGMDGSDFDRGIARAQASAEAFSKKLGGLGQTMSLAVTAPLVGVAGMAVKSAGDFEQSMNVMGQVTGATGEQMAQMQAKALELGAVTAFSAGEAAEAMLELGKAGLTPNEIMGAIGGTMDLAAAGNLGLAEAATIAANAMNAFQLPAEQTTEVANMLAAAANASSVDVTDLAAGMQMAGAVFASSGQSVQDLTTAMAILGNNAISGSDAGTSLKTMLMRLAAPTDDAAAVMSDLGLQVFNADGSMRGFADIVGQLERATVGLSDQERTMALNTIFGADAIRAATILAREGADGFADMSKAVNKQGAAAATANARMKGIGGAVEYLKGSIDSFLINAALPFLDSLSGIVRGAADLLTMVGELPAPVRNMALAFAAVAAATGPVLLIVSKLIPVFGMVGTVLGALASPVGLIVLAVAALGAAWATNFGGIRDTTMAVLAPVIEGLQSFGNYIVAVVEDGDTLNDWLTHLPGAIQPAVQKFGEMVAELKKWIDLAMSGDFSGLWTEIGSALNSVRVAVATFDWGDYITSLDWGGYIQTALDWGTYITDTVADWGAYIDGLGWDDYILATLADWGAYVTALDWGGYIQTALDWGTYITATITDWGAYVSALVWSDYITPLWVDYIKPLVWDDYMAKLDWQAIGLTVLDWALWIPAIVWTAFITPVRWVSHIAALVWNAIIDPLFWNDFLPKLASWSEYLSKLDWNLVLNPVAWGVYISTIDWGKYLPVKFAWSKFVEKIDWLDHIPGLTWPTFNAPNWSNFVEKLAWPTINAPSWSEFIDSLEWPKIPDVKWEDFIPDIKWPTIPSFPGWVDILRALGLGQSISATPAATGQNPATQSGSGTTGGVNTPLPNNGGYPVDVNSPPPQTNVEDITGGSAMGRRALNIPTDFGNYGDMGAMAGAGASAGPLVGPVYVTNEVDLQALAYQVAQLLNRRRM